MGLSQRGRTRRVTAKAGGFGLELADQFIDRIEGIDGELTPCRCGISPRSRGGEASRCGVRAASAAVLGVPSRSRNTYNVAGLPTTWGITAAKDFIPPKTRCRGPPQGGGRNRSRQDNVPLGLGDAQSYNDIYGTTNNPSDRTRSPGGSSGGSSAALAAVSVLCRSAATSAARCAFRRISAEFAPTSRPLISLPSRGTRRRASPLGRGGDTWPSSARWRARSTTLCWCSTSSLVRTRRRTGAPTASTCRRRGARKSRISAFSSSPNIRCCRPRRRSALARPPVEEFRRGRRRQARDAAPSRSRGVRAALRQAPERHPVGGDAGRRIRKCAAPRRRFRRRPEPRRRTDARGAAQRSGPVPVSSRPSGAATAMARPVPEPRCGRLPPAATPAFPHDHRSLQKTARSSSTARNSPMTTYWCGPIRDDLRAAGDRRPIAIADGLDRRADHRPRIRRPEPLAFARLVEREIGGSPPPGYARA